MRAMWLSLCFLVTACGGGARSSPTAGSPANAAVDPSGEWAVRWDRGPSGWQPTYFNGTLDVWRDGDAWRASLGFRESVATYAFSSLTVDGAKVSVAFRAPSQGQSNDQFLIKGTIHDGSIDGEAQWGPISWTPFRGYLAGAAHRPARPDPALAITGVVVNPDGTPAPNAVVTVVAGNTSSRETTDGGGHFTVHSPVAGDALLYAYEAGRSARAQGAFGPDKSVTLKQVAMAAFNPTKWPKNFEGGLYENATFKGEKDTFPNGCHICEVEIDPDTGEVQIVNFTAVDDFGNIINPMVVEGQVHGGIAQGVGQALLEAAVYDKGTGQLVSGSYMDYTMPRAENFPSFKLGYKVTPCPHNPLGVKGCGEAGAIASPAAVMNAVHNALAPLGVTHVEMPATSLNVWQSIQGAHHAAAE